MTETEKHIERLNAMPNHLSRRVDEDRASVDAAIAALREVEELRNRTGYENALLKELAQVKAEKELLESDVSALVHAQKRLKTVTAQWTSTLGELARVRTDLSTLRGQLAAAESRERLLIDQEVGQAVDCSRCVDDLEARLTALETAARVAIGYCERGGSLPAWPEQSVRVLERALKETT